MAIFQVRDGGLDSSGDCSGYGGRWKDLGYISDFEIIADGLDCREPGK